jgi:putative lumazine-binding protein
VSSLAVPLYLLVVACRDLDNEGAAIERTVLDYFEGWFGGDPVRMERALHPELVKRSLEKDAPRRETLRTITAEAMIEATARGEGKNESPGDLGIEIEVEDVLGGLANVTVRSVVYTEYLHLARTSDGWKIVNDLWQQTPARRPEQ